MILVRSRRTPAKMRHLRGLARVFAYFSAMSLVLGAFSVRAARADVREHTLAFGREMLALANASQHDVTPVLFNGQRIALGSSITDDAPETVLDRYADHCRANPGQPAGGLEDLGTTKDATPPSGGTGITGTGLVRSGDGDEGTVVCFVRGSETKPTLGEAFRSFAETGELGAFGRLRYVYAKKTPSGRTHVLTAWTADRFDLLAMMPEEGKDVAGGDFPEIPRPPESERALSALAEGLPYGVNVYRTRQPATEVLAFYDREMLARGFRGYDPELDPAKAGGVGHAFVKNGVVLTVGVKSSAEGNFVALGLAGVPDHASPRERAPAWSAE